MRRYYLYLLLFIGFLGSSCEDVIDINLNDANPKLVIIGEVSNSLDVSNPLDMQVVISRTVSFGSDKPFDPISGAMVEIHVIGGRTFSLSEVSPGVYRAEPSAFGNGSATSFSYIPSTYQLHAIIDGEYFTATSAMPAQVTIDSIGTVLSNIFGEERKFVRIKYQDPPHVANYYRFLRSVNGSPFQLVYVTNDKFNDGKYISEDLADFETELVTGDSVVIRMQCIDKATFDFWNAVQSINPGTAAPANPPSVFGDGALGYFSAHALSEVSTVVQ